MTLEIVDNRFQDSFMREILRLLDFCIERQTSRVSLLSLIEFERIAAINLSWFYVCFFEGSAIVQYVACMCKFLNC